MFGEVRVPVECDMVVYSQRLGLLNSSSLAVGPGIELPLVRSDGILKYCWEIHLNATCRSKLA